MSRPFPPCDRTGHGFHDVATGIRMHVAEAGPADGPVVVLLHGWPQHWWCWRGVIGPLADAGLRVVVPDLRGSGWSDAPPGEYRKEQLAADVLALLDTLGIQSATVVGHDWGGWTAQLMALMAPERVKRLVLCNIAPIWPSADRATTARNVWRLGYQVIGAPRLGPRLQRSRWLLHRMLDGVPEADHEEFMAALRQPGRAEAGAQLYRTFLRRELPAMLRGRYAGRRLTMPTRVLHGVDDPVVRPFMVEGFHAHADEVEIEWVADCGHFIVDERPALVAGRVLAFLPAAPGAPSR